MDCTDCVDDMIYLLPRFRPNMRKHVPIVAGILVPLILPVIYFCIIYYVWTPYKPNVDRDQCSCSCWDSVFKGSYEEYPARYKHVYFNSTWNTLVIYLLTLVSIVALYELTKNLVKLVARRQARISMVMLVTSSIYAHYYSYWTYFNAYNDDFYDQFWHQAIFTVTEIVSTVCVFQMCKKNTSLDSSQLLTVVTIAVFHIVANCLDQFVTNVVQNAGEWHQFTRDVGFMTVDFLHLVVSGYHLHEMTKESTEHSQLASEGCFSVVAVCLLLFVSRIV